MKTQRIVLLALLLISYRLVSAQQTNNGWDKWNYLIGEWVGEGNGQPGQGDGKFSFQTDLDGKIMVRKNHTSFPATATTKAFVHDDLLIVYASEPGTPREAIYFDNEGHTIKYKVTYTDKAIVLTSNEAGNGPVFRLSYVTIDNRTVSVNFEMASPQSPGDFKMYLSGKAFKVTP